MSTSLKTKTNMFTTINRYWKRLKFKYKFFEDSERIIDQITPMLIGIIILTIVWLLLSMTGTLLARVAVEPKVALASQPYYKSVTISFNRPIKNSVRYAWQQSIKGTWHKTGSFGMVTGLVFEPEHSLPAGALLELDLENVVPLVDMSSGTKQQQVVYIQVQSAPTLNSIVPANGASNVLADTVVQAVFSSPNHALRNLVLKGDLPLISIRPSSHDDKTFEWKRSAPLQQGRQYTATLLDTAQPNGMQVLATYSFTTVAEPHVTASHAGLLYSGHTLDLNFDTDMIQTEKAVQFDIAGSGAWLDARQYRFIPTDFTQGKTWGYRVLAGAKSVAGGYFTVSQEFSVSTPGPVVISYAVPTGNRVGTAMRIAVTFDKTVYHSSAEAAFSISPYVAGTFSWSNDTLIYTHTGLQPATRYTVTVAAGVRPTLYGVPSTGYTMTFTTAR